MFIIIILGWVLINTLIGFNYNPSIDNFGDLVKIICIGILSLPVYSALEIIISTIGYIVRGMRGK